MAFILHAITRWIQLSVCYAQNRLQENFANLINQRLLNDKRVTHKVVNVSLTDAQARYFEGNLHMTCGNLRQAEACFRMAIQISPEFAEAYANLALVLEKAGKIDEAEACYGLALSHNSAYSEIHLNLGALLAKQKRYAEAEIEYAKTIALKPDAPVGWSNMGVLYACTNRELQAEQCYRNALTLDKHYATARFNLSYLLLRQGRFDEGWSCLEARNWIISQSENLTCPRWQGESLMNKSILICSEAGHGDMLQFCRYVGVLNKLGAKSVSMICHPALKTLFCEMAELEHVVAFDEPLPEAAWDFYTPMMSLPYHCKTRLDNIPADIPYLKPPANRLKKWGALLPDTEFNVGLVWKGSPQHENDADRSLPSLNLLSPLLDIVGINFFSLQKDISDESEKYPCSLKLTYIGHQLTDFADTAAALSRLDLLICVDTAVAHLAGALGTPCWVLLPAYKTDWRWLKDRIDSPWYPKNMKLFRQSSDGDWGVVIAQVISELNKMIRR